MLHVTWIPKYRKKKIYGKLRKYPGRTLRGLAKQKECEVLEGYLMSDRKTITVFSGSHFKPLPLVAVYDYN